MSVSTFTSTATIGTTCPSDSVSLSSPPLTTMWSTTPACHIAQQTCPSGYIGKRVYVCEYRIHVCIYHCIISYVRMTPHTYVRMNICTYIIFHVYVLMYVHQYSFRPCIKIMCTAVCDRKKLTFYGRSTLHIMCG